MRPSSKPRKAAIDRRRDGESRSPDDRHERRARRRGRRIVAGVDEVGRGAWAGPAAAAAVVLDPDDIPEGLDDSKKLTPARREDLYFQIRARAVCGVGVVDAGVIDETSIVAAVFRAMGEAVADLGIAVDHLLVDGRSADIPGLDPATTVETLIGGDGLSVSIAAASIVAKVTRDRMMIAYGAEAPEYGFALHKGYGTQRHRLALARFGPTFLHRKSFRPVAAAAKASEPTIRR